MKKIPNKRLFPLDTLRGLLIMLMALDHANYFIAQQHSPGEHWGGSFPAYESALPFLTRLVTHLCAPGFFFLMGAGMLLFSEARRKQNWDPWQVISHFWLRGSVLIALQLFVVNPIWKAGPEFFPETYIGVLVALGGGMILGCLLLRLNSSTLLLVVLGLMVGTELLHPSPEMWGMQGNEPWNLLFLYSGGNGAFWSNYPVLPWMELVAFGMVFGNWLLGDEKGAWQKGLWLGIFLLGAFAVLRNFDGFGVIRPRAGESWIDFLNVVKYPPSLVFTFMTMGVNLMLLWIFSRNGKIIEALSKPLVTFGREPLFTYVMHLWLYMLMGRYLAPNGMSIPNMLPYWLLGLLILYPLTLAYGRLKRIRADLPLWRYL
jgi:uncharacterized membrane protein